jgi:hypothetical protein
MTTDLILSTLERAADKAGDITSDVYLRWYSRCPEAERVMAHVDEHMQGRMLAEVLRLVMTPEPSAERSYLAFETRSHTAYGVTPSMYGPLLVALRDTVRAALDDQWTAAADAAWTQRVDALLREIASAC